MVQVVGIFLARVRDLDSRSMKQWIGRHQRIVDLHSRDDISLSTAGAMVWSSLSDPRAGQTLKCCRLRRYFLPFSVCTTYDLGVW